MYLAAVESWYKIALWQDYLRVIKDRIIHVPLLDETKSS